MPKLVFGMKVGDPSSDGDATTPIHVLVERAVKQLASLDQQLTARSQEEIFFDAFVQHYLSQAAQAEAARIRLRWMAFLQWCSRPEQEELLQQHNLVELAGLSEQVLGCTRSTGSVLSFVPNVVRLPCVGPITRNQARSQRLPTF